MIDWHQRHTWLVFSASEVDRCREAEYTFFVYTLIGHAPNQSGGRFTLFAHARDKLNLEVATPEKKNTT